MSLNILPKIIEYEHFQDLIFNYMFKIENEKFKEDISLFLKNLIQLTNHENFHDHLNFLPLKKKLISMFFNDLLNQAIISQKSTFNFFLTIQHFLPDIKNNEILEINLSQKIERLIELIKKTKPQFMTDADEDRFKGIFYIIYTYLDQNPELIKYFGQNLSLVEELLINCIFKNPFDDNKIGPKCTNNIVITLAFKLLSKLGKNSENLKFMIDYLYPLLTASTWRNSKISNWIISANDKRRNSDYVGLKNLGCSNVNIFEYIIIPIFLACYINSLMQQMYMIESFRKILMNVYDPKFDKMPKEDNILFHFKVK